MAKVHKLLIGFLIFSLAILLSACNESTNLKKVKGDGFVQSEHYQFVNVGDKITYYKPLDISEVTQHLPSEMKDHLNNINLEKLPFIVEEKLAYVVGFTTYDSKESLHQLQLTYLGENDEFFIVGMTELAKDPFDNALFEKDTLDLFGNKVQIETLHDNLQALHYINQTASAPVYKYYSTNDKRNYVGVTATRANEINFYQNGILYQIGYSMDNNDPNEMVALARMISTSN